MDRKRRELEAVIARYARRQMGNVTRRQLLAGGWTPTMVDRIRNGSLRVVFRGVYLAGYGPAPPLSRECAAVLACAPRALLSNAVAARLWEPPSAPPVDEIDVTVVGRQIRGRPGLRVHGIGRLAPGELARHAGIPVTSPALTLLDHAGSVTDDALAAAVNDARVRRLVTDAALLRTLDAHPRRRGARALRRLLASELAEFVTESDAEARCLRLMLSAGLKPDAAQAWVGPYRADFLFASERLIVEVDGYRYHSTRDRFVADRRRVAALMARGYVIFPISWADLVERPDATMAALAAALEARRHALRTS